MRNAVFISAGLHVAAIALTVSDLPPLFDSDPVEFVAVTVELVTLTEEEKPAPAPVPKAKPEPPPAPAKPPPEPPPAPEVKAPPPKPEPPPPPEPAVEKVPDPTPPEPAPKPVAKPKPKPKPKLKLLARKAVVPQPKHKPRPPPTELQALLKNIGQEKKKDENKRLKFKQPPDPRMILKAPAAPAPSAPRPLSPIEQRRLVATLSQEVMRQVSPCWSIPAGVKDAHTIRVGVRIYLKPDGTLSGPPRVEDGSRMGKDHAFRAVAESALRALRNPRCSPLKLPLKSYDTWREITFNFDPREQLR